MSPLWQIILAGVGTYLLRLSFIGLSSRLGAPSPQTEATLRLIAPAVLAAIVANQLFVSDGGWVARWDWWIAGVVAGLVAWRWQSAGLTMLVGMIVVWVLDATLF
ncbi:MAG: AzlD domain-containing protein [Ornithinimicrobium sp.]